MSVYKATMVNGKEYLFSDEREIEEIIRSLFGYDATSTQISSLKLHQSDKNSADIVILNGNHIVSIEKL